MKLEKRKKIFRVFSCLFIFIGLYIYSEYKFVCAKQNQEVLIIVDETKAYDYKYTANIQILFSNKKLYNENVFLSYHVYNKDGADIQYENNRVPFTIDESGKAKVELSVNLSTLSKSNKNGELIIKYDLVDEKNVYWFSNNFEISFITDITSVEYKPLINIYNKLCVEIKEHYIIFAVNVIISVFSITYILKLKKSQLFV